METGYKEVIIVFKESVGKKEFLVRTKLGLGGDTCLRILPQKLMLVLVLFLSSARLGILLI